MKTLFKSIIVTLLTWEAKRVLRAHNPKIIAITGTVGKTTTKDALFEVIRLKYKNARKNQKSFNSEIGVPLTILGAPNGWGNPFLWAFILLRGLFAPYQKNYPKVLVLEAGVDKPNDMVLTTSIIKPDITFFTDFSGTPVHVSNFKSTNDVLSEKAILLQNTKKDGVIFLGGDHEFLKDLQKLSNHVAHIYTYGRANDKDVRGEHEIVQKNNSYVEKITAHIKEKQIVVEIEGALGGGYMYAVCAGLALAHHEQIDFDEAKEALHHIPLAPGRMRIIKGVKGSIIIDDTYNSSPKATINALMTLKNIPIKGKRFVILGDMRELGEKTEEAHRAIGQQVATIADRAYFVGPCERYYADGALDGGMSDLDIHEYETAQEAGKEVEKEIKEGDIVLIKGSQGVRMERAVLEIMAQPENAKELLVRQDSEWENR